MRKPSGNSVIPATIHKYFGSAWDVIKELYDNLAELLGLTPLVPIADDLTDIAENIDEILLVNTNAEEFNKHFLGAHEVEPTVDGNGDPLAEGAQYWNSANDLMYTFDGTQWILTSGFGTVTLTTATGNGVTTAFNLDIAPKSVNNTSVFIQGVYQEKDTYTITGKQVVFNEAPLDGLSIEIVAVLASSFVSGSDKEYKTLASGQTVVAFDAAIGFATFYVSGDDTDSKRLILGTDYTSDLETNEITLLDGYPAGTVIEMVYGFADDIPIDIANLRDLIDANTALINTNIGNITINANAIGTLKEHGISVWDTDTTYPINGIAKGSDGELYLAVTEQSGNDPTSDDGTNWKSLNLKGKVITVSDMTSYPSGFYSNEEVIETSEFNLPVEQKWKFLTSEPSSGFYISGTGGWFVPLRKVKTRANLREFGLSEYSTPGVGSGPECSSLIASAFSDGVKELIIDDECYIGIHGTVISESDITLKGSGRIWIDWGILPAGSIGTPIYPLTFTGDNVTIKKIRSNRVGGIVAWVEDEYAAMLLMTGENATVRHTNANYHRNYCFGFNSGKKIKFIGNSGVGLLDGLSQQTGIHGLLQLQDTLDAVVSHNSGEGWTNGVLLGLSPERTRVVNNKFRKCGNHSIYGSSADSSYVANNESIGQFTDLKFRGDFNTLMGNKVIGGSLSMTNRVVDTGNGFAANSIVCMNNEVSASRDLSVGLAIQSRTGFDGPVADVFCSGNTVVCRGSNIPNGLLILFESIDRVTYSGNSVTCLGTITDGVRITPTDGISQSKIKSLAISGGHSIGAQDQAYQLTASKLIMSGFIAESGGGTGVNGGGVVAYTDRASLSGFDVETTNNVYGINFRTGVSANLNCGTITRPVGGTLPHVIANGFTPNEGSELVKVN